VFDIGRGQVQRIVSLLILDGAVNTEGQLSGDQGDSKKKNNDKGQNDKNLVAYS
jgi:hypothetical protein